MISKQLMGCKRELYEAKYKNTKLKEKLISTKKESDGLKTKLK